MMFMLLSIAIAVITVVFLLLPLFQNRKQVNIVERDAVNIEVAGARLSELRKELEEGQITDEQFQKYRLELETVAYDDLSDNTNQEEQGQTGNTVLGIIIALVVPLFSLSVYEQLGNEQALSENHAMTPEDGANSKQELEEFIASVEKDIELNPENVESRIALGQVYVELERYSEAAVIYRQLYSLRPDDPGILVDYAEALALFHGNRLTGKPAELLDKALSLEPNNTRALWLAGFASLQTGDGAQTLKHWQRLQAGLEPGSEIYLQVEKLLSELGTSETSLDSASVQQEASVKKSITVNVSVAAELVSEIDPDTTLFVFARAAKGPPMPLAVHRGKAEDIPLTVVLDDSMAMMPSMSLSSFPEVIVGVRLSANGQPQGQSGDFEGYSATLEVATSPHVDVVINSIKP